MLVVTTISVVLNQLFGNAKSAFHVVASATIILMVIHLGVELDLKQTCTSNCDSAIIRGIKWYLFFAITYLAHVVFCCYYCLKKGIDRDVASVIFLFSFIFCAVLQVIRFIDRYIFQTNFSLISDLYRSGIPAVNSLLTILVVVTVFLSVCKKQNLFKNLSAVISISLCLPILKKIIRIKKLIVKRSK